MHFKKSVYFFATSLFLFLLLALFFVDLEDVFNGDKKDKVIAGMADKTSEQNFYPANYESDFKKIFDDYKNRIDSDDLDLAYVKQAQDGLLKMKVPAQHKDEHLKTVLSLKLMEDFLSGGDSQNKISSEKIMRELQTSYSWLN